ncbi:aspartyl/asparaginyl beta-hydroxylase domain-containing protein [Phenylobacterium sp.]|jgi:aspartyl/asparaginyl beta-hydroxylase (cupin superfamily)|uniref:aspartyl/asparaginyl beta-hydroxylase domain-containing protein n=1 Tax=Phenylobacterium sp. TaxID=1871053 RepID=UPI002E31CCF7|nr:aspartyl/asparaginyl beta-hydroxylase domain-containing protein [Phenylobacterium sp.]HEX3367230.1 aspartyl/asparaginyl beta-hydroxylase domain-containing protein [Phenylobacterium sp.]
MTSAERRQGDQNAAIQAALQRGDRKAALSLLREAERADPGDKALKMQRAMICRALGDLAGALSALEDALALDPYDFVALLSKGALMERSAGERAAAAIYRNALLLAPPEDELPPPLRAPTARAREVVARTRDALEAHLKARTDAVKTEVSDATRRRFDESLGIFSGRTKVYVQEPLLLNYPRLPAIPFYDRSLFPWFEDLEAATDTIRGELEVALDAAKSDFAPYIAYPKGAPVNQWGELNHSPRWSSLHLWRDGVRQDDACKLCPKTTALLETLPLSDQPGYAPTAMFSALDAKTHIPAHTGSTNVRLLCHLPLILPGPARFRVGNETREWKMGQAWVFDDTIEHEAWNDADELRVILIFDVWNPFIDEGEKALVRALLAARKEFYES